MRGSDDQVGIAPVPVKMTILYEGELAFSDVEKDTARIIFELDYHH